MLKNYRFAVVRTEAFIALQLMKSSRVLSHVNCLKTTEVRVSSLSHLIMGIHMVYETPVIFNQLTWMIGREYFFNICSW
jgi:hypothetical protein